ncbi:hypothetical protein, partial [Klebsiella pneumoniae]|uniref:hypothetical protein n=1 Tax=Klebsiella pneumoniae TaxID=573 RepID=UPI001C6FC3B2
MCIDHVLTFPVPLEDASLLADYCGFEVYPTYSTNRADETPRFSVVALHRGGKREPQKIPPFRIVEFFGGVVRGMTTRQR